MSKDNIQYTLIDELSDREKFLRTHVGIAKTSKDAAVYGCKVCVNFLTKTIHNRVIGFCGTLVNTRVNPNEHCVRFRKDKDKE
jgi:hypothetical protein